MLSPTSISGLFLPLKKDSLWDNNIPFITQEVGPMLQVREHQQYHTKILTLAGEYTRNSTAGIQAQDLGVPRNGLPPHHTGLLRRHRD